MIDLDAPPKPKPPLWQRIDKTEGGGIETFRCTVPGGYLYMVKVYHSGGAATSMTFVPRVVKAAK